MIPGQEQNSAIGTTGSLAWEAGKFLTIGNPLWTRRIGTVGWDSRGRGAWAATKRMANNVLAPGANDFWSNVRDAGKAARVQGRVGQKVAHGAALAEDLLGVSSEKIAAASKHGTSWFGRVTGTSEASVATMGREAMHDRMGGLFGAAEKFAARHGGLAAKLGAATYVAGRVATAVNLGLLAWGAGKLTFGAFGALASVGQAARQNYQANTWGSGVGGGTARQQAMTDMQTRSWAPRSLIGGEAPFLHS